MEKTQAQTTFKRLLSYIASFKLMFFVAIVGMIGYSSIDAFIFSQMEPLIDRSLADGDSDFLRLVAYLIVPLMMVRGIANFLGTYALSWIGSQVVMKMRQQLFEHFMALPVSYHHEHSTGSLISKVTYDTEQVANASSKALLTLVREGAFVIGLLVVMFSKSWQLSSVFFIITPVVAGIVFVVSKRFRMLSKNLQQAMGKVTSSVEQMLSGHKVVLMFGGQKLESERFKQSNNHNRQQSMKLVTSQVLSVISIQVIASVALAVTLYIASIPTFLETLSPGIFLTVVLAMLALLKPLKQLTTVNSEFQRGLAASNSVFTVLDQAKEVDLGTQKFDRAQGNITFDKVNFSYPTAHNRALNEVSFNVSAGQTVALVGPSGSGKSTISNLLTRFYNIESGCVSIDGTNLENIPLADLRKQFALVSQHVILFNDTIANNIAYACKDEVSKEDIIRAAEAAHVMEFAQGFKDGLDTEIGEGGANLSGGQRQRIAIARAILRDAPILILDEATSALDTESEKYIQQALEELQKEKTSIVIAHRLSTIESADNILVVENGRIVESGQHKALLEKQGAYAQLHRLQFGDDA